MACECCREGAIHYSTASAHQYTPLGNQPSSHVSQMSEGPACCHHHDSPHMHAHHGSVHHHTVACSASHCSHQQRHRDAATTEDCCRCSGRSHHIHRHMPPIASPLSITHAPNLPCSPPMFHTPQAVCRSQERCRCQPFLTPQHHQLRLSYGANPRRQLLGVPAQHHYHKQQQHSQAVGHQSYHFSENANYDVNVGHTHAHNHISVQHQPSSPLSSYAQPLPPSPQASQPCVNQIGHGETFHLDFSPPCSNASMPTLPRSHFQLAPSILQYEDPCTERNGSRSNSQQENSVQPLYSGLISSHANSTPQLPSHHNQPSQLEHSHPHSNPQQEHSSHSIPAISRPASIPLPRPEVVIERLPLSITKREKVLSSCGEGSKSEAPSQTDTSGNQDLLNEDPLGGLEKERGNKRSGLTDQPEQPGLTDRPEPVIPKSENRSLHKKWYPAAIFTDTDSDQVSDGQKRSLRLLKQRQASKEGGAVKLMSPRRTRRRATPIVIDTTETESEGDVKPPKALRKAYPLRSKKKVGLSSAELEIASSVGQRVRSSSGFQTRQRGTDSEEKRKAKERASQTDSDSEPSPRRGLRMVESTGRLEISEDEENSALEEEVKVRGEVTISQAEQHLDSDQQLQAVTVKEDPSSLETGGDGDEPEPVDVEPDSILSQPVDGAEEEPKGDDQEEEPKGDDQEKGKQLVVLEGWYFRIVADGLVILEGTKENDVSGMKWHSGPVARRQSARDLVTRSGAGYHLSGELSRELLCKAGGVDSKNIARRFRNGFPKDWATLLQRYFEEQQKVEPEKVEPEKVEPEEGGHASVVDQGNEEREKVTVKSEQDEFKTPVLDYSPATLDFLSSLKRSSRGRTLKPSAYSMSPFLNLSPDLYTYDMCGSFQGISSPVIDLTGEGTYIVEPKKPKRRVKMETVSGTVSSEVVKRSVKIMQKSKIQSSSCSGQEQFPERRADDKQTGAEAESNSEGQKGGIGGPRRGAFFRIVSDGTESDNSSVERVQKRGRGRPRTQKWGVEGVSEQASMEKVTESDNSSVERVQKRGRGRPRTQKWGVEGVSEQASMEKVTESDNSSVEMVQKSGRGRASEQASMKKVEPRLRISKEAAVSVDTQEEWTLRGDPREDEELEWATEDFRSLKSIVHAVPAMTTNFWEVVARRLGTGHSARECSKQYLQATARGPKRMPGKLQERPGATAAPVITGKAGTMKRKRQIRSALEHMDRGYSDDIFDSTPFKKKMKRVELQELSDDECFHGIEMSEESRPIRTPSEAKRRLGAPTSHTPKLSDYLTTPDLKSGMRREAADNVMYKIQKAKKGPKKPLKKSATAAVPKGKLAVHEPLLRNIRTGEVTAIRMFEDSDDDSAESSPFSDIEDTYRDIITRLH